MKNKTKKVILAISGGVDSSVSAHLLKKQKYEVVGVFMRLDKKYQENEAAARRVCSFLGIKFYPINLSDKFKKEVKDYFVDSYKQGITPNPCVKCNKLIKFGELFRVMEDLGGDFLATGHYVRIERGISNKIFKGTDTEKDQTYFLYNLKQKQLDNILFPVGNMKKNEVRKIADKLKIPYTKKESQDVCFLVNEGKIIDHNEYLKKYIKQKPGLIKSMDGKVIGEHKGLSFYTIGQRRGIEVGGTGPYYAAKFDYANNILYVVDSPDDKVLFCQEFVAKDVNWISEVKVDMIECEAVIRYRHKQLPCVVQKLNNFEEYQIKLQTSQRAVTPGQSVVFYRGDELLGGGIIK